MITVEISNYMNLCDIDRLTIEINVLQNIKILYDLGIHGIHDLDIHVY